MRTIWIIIKHEITKTMSKPSFWVMTLLFPAVLIGLNLLSLKANQVTADDSPAAGQNETETIGFVDLASLITRLPTDLPEGVLVRYPEQPGAEAALRRGSISQLVIIPKDYAQNGRLEVILATFNPLASTSEDLFQYLIAYNLIGDESAARQIAQPSARIQEHALAAAPAANPFASSLPYTVLMIFFYLFTLSSSLMLQSVSREKVNRTAEVLLLSLEPRQLMLGKILGLSVVAFFQMLVWAAGLLLLNRDQVAAQAAAAAQLPGLILLPTVLFFALGYFLYASLMGAVGALAPSAKDGGQVTFFLILPLMIPMLLSTAFSEAPNGGVPVLLSLFPFTAPTAMLARLVLAPVPLWQIGVSLGLLGLTTALVLRLAARAFRADALLSTAALNLPKFIAELREPSGSAS